MFPGAQNQEWEERWRIVSHFWRKLCIIRVLLLSFFLAFFPRIKQSFHEKRGWRRRSKRETSRDLRRKNNVCWEIFLKRRGFRINGHSSSDTDSHSLETENSHSVAHERCQEGEKIDQKERGYEANSLTANEEWNQVSSKRGSYEKSGQKSRREPFLCSPESKMDYWCTRGKKTFFTRDDDDAVRKARQAKSSGNAKHEEYIKTRVNKETRRTLYLKCDATQKVIKIEKPELQVKRT